MEKTQIEEVVVLRGNPEAEKTTEKNGFTTEKEDFSTEKTTEKNDFTTEKEDFSTEKTTEKIFRAIKDNPYITTKELALEFDITGDGVFYHIRKLRIAGRIQRVGGRKSGCWEVLK